MEDGDLTGAILDGRYRVLEPVAQGAMGTVYRAERVKLGRIVAVKVLHDVLPHELSARKRFEIEAMAMAKLEHPHCASVLDIGVHNDRPFVVMDFVSGPNLKELIASGPQSMSRSVEIVRQVLTGLAHAHELGIIHRDIKPANLVLSQKTGLGDHVKILDFGLARLQDAGQSLTSGIVVGTPAYMAPEQIRGYPLDPRVDLYACGVLLFELLTARKPFHSESDDPIDVCRMHLSSPIPRLGDKLPGIDFGELEAVVAKALAKDRNGRYASAQEYAAALDAAFARRPPRSRPAPPSGPIELGSDDMLAANDASNSAEVEVRTADVIAAIPDVPPAAGEPDLRSSTTTVLEEMRTATPAGLRAARSPSGSHAAAPLGPRVATPPAGIRTATPPAGTATPPAGSRSAAIGPAPARAEEVSAPGTFLGLSVRPPTPVPRADSQASGSQRSRSADSGSLGSQDAASQESGSRRSQPAARGRSARWRRSVIVAGCALVVAAATVVVVATRSAPSPGKPGGSAPARGSAVASDPTGDIILRANELAAQGERDAALELLHRARRQYPDNAVLAYTAGRICFSKFYWSEGLRNFRDAVRSDPAYRADPELIKIVLRGFITTPSYNDDLAGFLRDEIGAAAQPFLEETARDHPSPMIRSRAASELRRYR